VLIVMMVASIGAIAAVQAANADKPLSAKDRERKQAYAAAEAGVNDYMARLVADVDYWRMCASDTNNPAMYDGVETPRVFQPIAGSTTGGGYSIETLPANGASSCLASDPVSTFIDATTGTFRIRSTGQVGNTRRSIIASFRRRGFLDYVYFTDYETPSPDFYLRDARNRPTRETGCTVTATEDCTIHSWARRECVAYYRDGGQRAQFVGERQRTDGTWEELRDINGQRPRCGEINFVTGDNQNGPFHTNDEILVIGSPRFGRRPSDEIEVSAPEPVGTDGVVSPGGGQGSSSGWRSYSGGSPSVNDPSATSPNPNWGTWRISSPILTMPPSNETLRDEALAAYRFVGETSIRLDGTNMVVTGRRENGTQLTNATIAMPNNGVIFVGNDPLATCAGYDVFNAPVSQPGCGNLRVRGTDGRTDDYKRSITMTAENDVIIEEDITRAASDDVMLGLIGDQWIRIHHPVTGYSSTGGSCTNNGGPGSITIHAAMLAVNDSFTVDRYWCGASLGTLSVVGSIAQSHRGAVGTGSGSTGYIKDYTYDDRLRFRSPPRFLDPVQAAWRLQAQVEQVPAT